ncbi:helix-turn-helix domain-containing protein [Suttonella ornithocola]|uniref:Transcriptional regulator, y4mF family n=1 Tax=Suttonella ornithocola TaxID=279832 RepID=A0A380MMT5_9GAMM|nr:helix-turn-helix transcriptional regulator [Suttonella ornithocola]SUO93612.1 transcriptional regulator, y4mF family [Suttonella ornithocola]
MEVTDKVKMMRELRNWSQEEMANRLGMSVNGYAKLERGETQMNFNRFGQIAKIFGITIEELMSINDRSVICLISENSTNSSNYYGGQQEFMSEIERLKLCLAHQEELLSQQKREIETLRLLVEQLQK